MEDEAGFFEKLFVLLLFLGGVGAIAYFVSVRAGATICNEATHVHYKKLCLPKCPAEGWARKRLDPPHECMPCSGVFDIVNGFCEAKCAEGETRNPMTYECCNLATHDFVNSAQECLVKCPRGSQRHPDSRQCVQCEYDTHDFVPGVGCVVRCPANTPLRRGSACLKTCPLGESPNSTVPSEQRYCVSFCSVGSQFDPTLRECVAIRACDLNEVVVQPEGKPASCACGSYFKFWWMQDATNRCVFSIQGIVVALLVFAAVCWFLWYKGIFAFLWRLGAKLFAPTTWLETEAKKKFREADERINDVDHAKAKMFSFSKSLQEKKAQRDDVEVTQAALTQDVDKVWAHLVDHVNAQEGGHIKDLTMKELSKLRRKALAEVLNDEEHRPTVLELFRRFDNIPGNPGNLLRPLAETDARTH